MFRSSNISVRAIWNEDLEVIFRTLLINGDEARLVGGCIRDLLLGEKGNDIDIATQHRPEETTRLLEAKGIKVLQTGVDFGTVTACFDNRTYEITSLRHEISFNGRHPQVEFCQSYEEDSRRRDFTINALYMDRHGKIYDYWDGMADLQAGMVRFIGDPATRIQEDHLRILRFFRFQGRFGRNIDYNSMHSCFELRNLLSSLSGESIKKEMTKILSLPNHLEVLELMKCTGIFEVLLDTKNINIAGLQLAEKLANATLELVDRCLILGSLGGRLLECRKIMYNRWQFNKTDKTFLTTVVEGRYDLHDPTILQELVETKGKDFAVRYLLCRYIEQLTQYELENILNTIETSEGNVFPVTAKDLLDAGLATAGPKIVNLLKTCRQIWVQSNFQLNKEKLLNKLKINAGITN